MTLKFNLSHGRSRQLGMRDDLAEYHNLPSKVLAGQENICTDQHIIQESTPDEEDRHHFINNEELNRIPCGTPASYKARIKTQYNVDAVDLRIRDLKVLMLESPQQSPWPFSCLKKSEGRQEIHKTILQDVTFDVPAGTLAAIIGTSGSGKTTLLNVMAERVSAANMRITGTVTFNWRTDMSSIQTGYVRQEDLLIPGLTVRETLAYRAELKLPMTGVAERERLVQGLIMELDLERCADNLVVHCSGGEKRRTSIGIQLIGRPSVLLVDEPTTGLDSTTALSVITCLKALSRKGHTVITTIHQPRVEIFSILDQVVLMSSGSPIYSGKAAFCLDHFAKLGYNAPENTNPAEFLIDITTIDKRSLESEAASQERIARLTAAWKMKVETRVVPRSNVVAIDRSTTTIDICQRTVRCTTTLIRRNCILKWRDKRGTIGSLLGALILGIVGGLVNLQLSRDQEGIRSRQGALYTAVYVISLVYFELELFYLSSDVRIFDQEREDGVSSALAYATSHRIAMLLTEDIPVTLMACAIFYAMSGLHAELQQFLIFFAFIFLSYFASRTWAMVAIACSREYSKAKLVGGLYQTVQLFGSGFLLNFNRMPVYVRWLRWVAYMGYAFGGLCSNEFSRRFYDCPLVAGEENPDCAPFHGRQILANLGLEEGWIAVPMAVVASFAVAHLLLAILILSFKRVPSIKVDNQAKSIREETQKDDIEIPDWSRRVEPVEITVEDLSIHVRKAFLSSNQSTKCIIKKLNVTFPPATFSAIIGSSGSGKSTLLKAVINRLGPSYDVTGRILFNNDHIVKDRLGYFCAFVHQNDEGLLPSLTVRETLRYAALLRLPRELSLQDKYRRAEKVLIRLGLENCASTRVGSENIKGISGGERRRVSIGIQLLSEPLVMILDEPTSGLDSSTSKSITALLKSLADEGCTVIATIHQAGGNDFKHFDNVILMAPGGQICYAGQRADMISYFENLGHYLPEWKSPADFASDLTNGAFALHSYTDLTQPDYNIHTLTEAWQNSRHRIRRIEEGRNEILRSIRRLERQPLPFSHTYTTLLSRSFVHHRRNRAMLSSRFIQVFSYGILLTLFFTPLRWDQAGVQTFMGYIFLLTAMCTAGLQQNSVIYPEERNNAQFELDDRASSVEAFLIQYSTLEVLCEIAASLVLCILTVFAVGLPRSAEMYLVAVYNCFLLLNCGESIGIIFFTVFSHSGFALTNATLVMYIVVNMSGIVTPNIPSVIRGINYASPAFHAASSLMPSALRDVKYTCSTPETMQNGTCLFNTGGDVLDLFHFNVNPGRGLLGLLIVAIFYRLLAYLTLKVKHSRFGYRLPSPITFRTR